MPGRICAVAVCKNNQLALKKQGSSIVFHCFPKGKDFVSSTLRKEWVHRCRKKDSFNIDTSAVCSDHFTVNDYDRDLQHELLNLPLRKILQKTAVPTVNLGQEIQKSTMTPRNERAVRKETKAVVDSLLASSSLSLPSTSKHHHLEVSEPTEDICADVEVQDLPQDLHKSPSATQTTEPESDTQPANYKMMYEELLRKYSSFRTTSCKKIKNLEASLAYYKNKYYNRSINRKDRSKSAEEILKMILTQNQIDLLSKSKKIAHWTQEEISIAFTLRYYSKKCYLYLRNKLKYPLPALSSLRRWASRLDVSQGLLKDILLLIKLAGEDLTDFEKTVVLQFDEVKVKSVQEYDVAKDQVLGPHSQML